MKGIRLRVTAGVLTAVFALYLLLVEFSWPIKLQWWFVVLAAAAIVGSVSPLLGALFRERLKANAIVFMLLWLAAGLLASLVVRGGMLTRQNIIEDPPYPYVPLWNQASFYYWGNMVGDGVRAVGMGCVVWFCMYWRSDDTSRRLLARIGLSALFFFGLLEASFWVTGIVMWSETSG